MPDIDSPNPVEVAKPWYRSTTIQGVFVMLIMMILAHYKINIPGLDGDVSSFVDLLGQLAGAGVAVYGRVKAEKIITATPAAAAKFNG